MNGGSRSCVLNWRQYPHPGGEDMLGRITAFAYGVACYVATLERDLLRIRARASAGPEESRSRIPALAAADGKAHPKIRPA
jgi:hypothetical protein